MARMPFLSTCHKRTQQEVNSKSQLKLATSNIFTRLTLTGKENLPIARKELWMFTLTSTNYSPLGRDLR